MANYIVSDTSLGSVADAIRTKGGTSAPLTYPQGFIDAIGDIQTGGSAIIQSLSVTQNGTYTAPSGVDGYSPVTVNVSGGGNEPIPEDGKTRIWIHIADGTPDNRLTFYLRFTASVADNTTVDWGDGTSEVKGSTRVTNYSHKYPSSGDYVITMTVNSGTTTFEGNSTNSIFGQPSNYYNRVRVIKIIFGNNVILGGSALRFCYALPSVVIPNNTTSIGNATCQNCYNLSTVIVPSNITSIGTEAFAGCYSLSELHFMPTTPPAVANTNAFNNIASDCKIYVPQGCLSAYQSATNYGNVASKMQEEST